MDFVNENAPPGSKILIWKNNLSGKYYSEGDFTFTAHTEVPEDEYHNYDYLLIPTNAREADPYFSKLPIAFSVDVDNVSIMLVLKIK